MKEGTIVNKDGSRNAGFDDEGRQRKLAMFDAVTDATTGAAVGASGALGIIVLGTSTLGRALPVVGTPLEKGGLPPISASPIGSKISALSTGNWLAVPFFRVLGLAPRAATDPPAVNRE